MAFLRMCQQQTWPGVKAVKSDSLRVPATVVASTITARSWSRTQHDGHDGHGTLPRTGDVVTPEPAAGLS